jgi:hypothetical protein
MEELSQQSIILLRVLYKCNYSKLDGILDQEIHSATANQLYKLKKLGFIDGVRFPIIDGHDRAHDYEIDELRITGKGRKYLEDNKLAE